VVRRVRLFLTEYLSAKRITKRLPFTSDDTSGKVFGIWVVYLEDMLTAALWQLGIKREFILLPARR